jgi:lipopolysaccharide exporter
MAMDRKALSSVPWTLLNYAVNKVIKLATTLILARILAPDDFGVVALATLVIGMTSLFKDLGLSGALVVRQDLDEYAQGTVFGLMLASGALITAAIVGLASPMASLLDMERLDSVLQVMGVAVLLGSVGWFYETIFQRDLEFRRIFVAQVYQNVFYAGLALGLAIAGAGVWSIVVAFVASTVIYAIALVSSAPVRIRPRWDLAVVKDVFQTGRGFLAQGVLGFIQQDIDKFAVGGILGSAQVGFYTMSYRLAELPYMAIADPVARVTFPEFARLHHEGGDVKRAFLSVLRLIAIVTVPIGALMSGAAAPFVGTVLGDKWTPMIASMAVLGVWSSVRTVQVTIAWLLNSLNHAGIMGIVSAFVLVPLIPGVIFAAHHGGTEGVAWVMLGDMVLSLATLSYLADRRCGVPVLEQAKVVWPAFVASAVTWCTTRLVAELMDGTEPAFALLGSVGVGMLTYVVVLSLVDRDALRTAATQIGATLARRGTTAGESDVAESAAPATVAGAAQPSIP